MNKEQRQKSLAYGMIQNAPEMKQLEANPQMKAQAIEKVAEKIGLDDTRKVIEALEWDEFLPQIDEAIMTQNQMVQDAGMTEAPKPITEPFDEDEEVQTFQ
jgi:L-lysine 2,3-aminomutase